ncbi:MAG: D-alanine--D-alanine ligase family protein, partial [Longimicrobiales bacterium]
GGRINVAILFDDVQNRPGATPDEWGVLEAVAAVEEVLKTLGHRPSRVPAGEDVDSWRSHPAMARAQAVFNLCEGLGGRSEGEVLAARVLEDLGLPITGSPSAVLAQARRKDQVNGLLSDRGLPVPPWSVWADGEGSGRQKLEVFSAGWKVYPAIVKPAAEDGSVGIDQGSVVRDAGGLALRLERMKEAGPLLVQAFVGTREINAAIVGHEVLPLSEILFEGLPEGHHPIVGYDAKWAPGSPEDLGTRPVCPAPVSGAVASRIRLMALKAWKALGGRGYGRVDFRLSPPDTLYLLEVNPNPDLSPSAGLARAAEAGGIQYRALVERILQEALS